MTTKFGRFFTSLTAKEVTSDDGLTDIELEVSHALSKELTLVDSPSNLVRHRGNIFRYTKGAFRKIDERIDALLAVR